MNWYIGQPIVAIKNSECGDFKKGQEFTIKGIRISWCNCGNTNIDIGLISHTGISRCGRCQSLIQNGGSLWKSEVCFAPLDQDISELTEILTQKQSL